MGKIKITFIVVFGLVAVGLTTWAWNSSPKPKGAFKPPLQSVGEVVIDPENAQSGAVGATMENEKTPGQSGQGRPTEPREAEVREKSAQPNFYAGKATVAERAEAYQRYSLEELNSEIVALDQTIKEQQWIERANQGELSPVEQEQLADLLQQEAGMRLALVQKKLKSLEDELL